MTPLTATELQPVDGCCELTDCHTRMPFPTVAYRRRWAHRHPTPPRCWGTGGPGEGRASVRGTPDVMDVTYVTYVTYVTDKDERTRAERLA